MILRSFQNLDSSGFGPTGVGIVGRHRLLISTSFVCRRRYARAHHSIVLMVSLVSMVSWFRFWPKLQLFRRWFHWFPKVVSREIQLRWPKTIRHCQDRDCDGMKLIGMEWIGIMMMMMMSAEQHDAMMVMMTMQVNR